DSWPTKTGGVAAFGAVKSIIKIACQPSRMQLGIHAAIVGLLINDEAFCTSFDNVYVILGIHRADLDGDRRKIGRERAHAVGEITAAHKLGMLARNKEDLAKSLPREMLRFGHDLIDGKCHAQDWIIPRETAILTIIDA